MIFSLVSIQAQNHGPKGQNYQQHNQSVFENGLIIVSGPMEKVDAETFIRLGDGPRQIPPGFGPTGDTPAGHAEFQGSAHGSLKEFIALREFDKVSGAPLAMNSYWYSRTGGIR